MKKNLFRGEFRFRFLSVSILNYLAGNLFFSTLWLVFGDILAFWLIVIISTLLASIFSYQTHRRISLRTQKIRKVVDFKYLIFQFINLILGILLIPQLAQFFGVNFIFAYFLWSGFASLIILLILINEKIA
jgi:Na+-transporting methylmalonyl-CoA/oxaloacetate decarboxylase beta subunit